MIDSLRKLPLWAWIACGVALFIAYQSFTGWSMSSKLWKQVFGQIKEDQSRVVKNLEDNQKMYEDEIRRLMAERDRLQKDREALQKQKAELLAQDKVKDAEIEKLRAARQTIVVPVDPVALADEFRRMGYGSTRYRSR
jgi:uncharacterized protein YlxW (UPF0749 family)